MFIYSTPKINNTTTNPGNTIPKVYIATANAHSHHFGSLMPHIYITRFQLSRVNLQYHPPYPTYMPCLL